MYLVPFHLWFVVCVQEWQRWQRWSMSDSRSWRTRSTVWCWSTPWTQSKSCCPSSSQVITLPSSRVTYSSLFLFFIKQIHWHTQWILDQYFLVEILCCSLWILFLDFRYQNLCNNQDIWQPGCGGGLEEPQLHFWEDECRDKRDHQSAAAYVLGRGCLGQQGTYSKWHAFTSVCLWPSKSHAHTITYYLL